MRALLFAVFALAACMPQQSPPTASAPDPVAIRYEVHIGQAALSNVRSVQIVGPDAELIEVRPSGGPPTLVPGRVGAAKLTITADWSATERTMENWRAGIMNVTLEHPISLQRQNVSVVIISGAATVTYAFQRCLPTEQQMEFWPRGSGGRGQQAGAAAEDARIKQVWGITCEGVVRS